MALALRFLGRFAQRLPQFPEVAFVARLARPAQPKHPDCLTHLPQEGDRVGVRVPVEMQEPKAPMDLRPHLAVVLLEPVRVLGFRPLASPRPWMLAPGLLHPRKEVHFRMSLWGFRQHFGLEVGFQVRWRGWRH